MLLIELLCNYRIVREIEALGVCFVLVQGNRSMSPRILRRRDKSRQVVFIRDIRLLWKFLFHFVHYRVLQLCGTITREFLARS